MKSKIEASVDPVMDEELLWEDGEYRLKPGESTIPAKYVRVGEEYNDLKFKNEIGAPYTVVVKKVEDNRIYLSKVYPEDTFDDYSVSFDEWDSKVDFEIDDEGNKENLDRFEVIFAR